MNDDVDPYFDALMSARPGEYGAGPEEIVQALLRRPEWHSQAACRGAGTELFFPGKAESSAEAKSLCSSCPVVDPCRVAGEGQLGVWGGTSGLDRRRDRRVIRSSGRLPAPSAGEAA